MKCNTCDGNANLFCTQCRSVHYCDKDCQRKDWRNHKLVCKTIVPVPLDAANKIPLQTHCSWCFEELGEILECIGCRSIRYCSKKCQLKHWKTHKSECKARGKYLFEQLLKSKSPDKIYNLALMYRYGTGTEKDEKKAFETFEVAAWLGDIESANNLGMCYFEGAGTEVNIDEAYTWVLSSAKANNIVAVFNMGIIYKHMAQEILENENSTEEDKQMGFEYLDLSFNSFLKSAQHGRKEAFDTVAYCYRHGIGTEKNDEQAIFWENHEREAK